jgi:hypothetical protein
MADTVNTGTTANDGTGDELRTAFQLINQRLQQLLGTLSQITWAPGLAIEATPARQWTVVAGQAYVAASNHIAGATFAADLAAGRWLAVDVSQMLTRVGQGRLHFGVFRQATAGAGWAALNDAGHVPFGFGAASVDGSGNLVLNYDYTSNKVGSLIVAPDETFAGLGLAAGASVANDKATVSMYKTLDFAANMQTLALTPSTYFAGTVSAVDNGDGTVTFTHPSCGSASVVPTITCLDGYRNAITGYTSTTVTVQTLVQFNGYIYFDGADWQVVTPARNKPTMVFSAGTLTVTHETLPTDDALISVNPRAASTMIALGDASTPTTFTAQFRDFAGALITTPSTSMRFYYQGSHWVRRAAPVGQIAIARPNAKLNAANVASGSGNWWVQGQMVTF